MEVARTRLGLALLVVGGLVLGACARHAITRFAPVDDAQLRAAASDPDDWITHGRTYREERYSPLAQIDASNVRRLGLIWSFDLETVRGVEATPLVRDGVMYLTSAWSVVHALDARTGAELWRWDPQVPRSYGRRACCDVVNRGVALYGGRVYVGTLDGRLVALDARSGAPVWEVVTVDRAWPYTITGAPRIVAGRVVIGNGGAEFGVRGYVSAYDAETGARLWRTYTVPGDPSLPFESPALAAAADTWSGRWWEAGGGGTVWDSMAYDPELELLYVGTGNGSPWSRYARSPGGGDNLYLSSILALRPETGELVWHFQTTPGDTWDYTATQHMILADLVIDGRPRKVLMQAPKNGFFYVIDRQTGEFISGEAFVEVSWATGLDASGRPMAAEGGDYGEAPRTVQPSSHGAHNWHSMSFHPGTGLVYIPAQVSGAPYAVDPDYRYQPEAWNTGTDFELYVDVPPEAVEEAHGFLLAWNPVTQREAWRVEHRTIYNGGVLSTAGSLVFQGTADGRFVAYRADDGAKLWESPAGTGVVAAPVTYRVDGVQYVTIAAGWGGSFALSGGRAAAKAGVMGSGRVLTFALDGTAAVPPGRAPPSAPPVPAIEWTASGAELREGGALFHRYCAVCHGVHAVGGGVIPDLRYASREVHGSFVAIVLGGTRMSQGMPSFADVLDEPRLRAIQLYVLSQAEGAPR